MTVSSAAPAPTATSPAPAAAAPAPASGLDPRTINAELLAQITNDSDGIARAEQLYNALPPRYQQHAQSIAAILTQFRSVERIGLPPEVSAQDAWQQFSERFIRDGGRLDPSKGAIPSWMAQMATQYGPTILRLPGVDTIVNASDTVRGGFDTSRGFVDGIGLPLRAIGTVFSQVQDTTQQVTNAFGEISPERALAFGTAYSAAMYSQTASPDAPASVERERTREPGFFEQAWARIQSWTSMLIHNTGGFGEFLLTAGNFITNGFDWNKAKTDAQTTLATERREGVPTYESILARGNAERAANADRTADAAARPAAAEMMIAARNVAGIDTTQVVPVLRDGGVFRAGDGSNVIIRMGADGPESQVMTGPDGQPIDFAARSAGRWENVTNVLFGSENSESYAQGAWAGAGVAGLIGYSFRNQIGGAAVGTWNAATGLLRNAVGATTGTVAGAVAGVRDLAGAATTRGSILGVARTASGETAALAGRAAGDLSRGAAALGMGTRGFGVASEVASFGVRRAIPVVGGLFAAGDFVGGSWDVIDGVRTGDTDRAVRGGRKAALVGGGAAIGGVLGGGVFSIPLALVGAGVGSLLDMGIGWVSGENSEPETNAPAVNGTPSANGGNMDAARAQAQGVNRNGIAFSGNGGPNGGMANVNGGAGPRMVLAAV